MERSPTARARQRWGQFVLLSLVALHVQCGSTPESRFGATGLPSELQGQWRATMTYVPAYWTGLVPTADFTGSLGVSLYLSADARYEFHLSSALTYFNGNCFRTTRWKAIGTVSVSGSDVTFTATPPAFSSVMDSCGQSSVSTPDPGPPETLRITQERDNTDWPMLRVALPSGEDLLLEKCRDCR